MIYDLSKTNEFLEISRKLPELRLKGSKIEVKELSKKRTLSQNSALHKYFDLIAKQFHELGWTYNYSNPFTGHLIELNWNTNLIKDFIWRPIQQTLFGIESTTELTSKQINDIIDVLTLHFGNSGIKIDFPNWQTWMNEIDKNSY